MRVEMEILRTGDQVTITYAGVTVPGRITLASPNGVSLVLGFVGVLGSYVDIMPVMLSRALEYRDLVEDKYVAIVKNEVKDL